jgi:hypothetical protein
MQKADPTLTRLDLNVADEQQQAARSPTWWVVHPFSEVRHRCDLVILGAMFYSGLVLPLQFAELAGGADEWSYGGSEQLARGSTAIFGLDQLCNLVFIFDLVLSFCTGYLDLGARTVVLQPRKIASHYLRGWFAVDLVATTPFDLITAGCGRACHQNAGARWGLKLLRVLRLCRLLRLSRILQRLQVRSSLKETTKSALHFSAGGLFIAHFAACIWFTIGKNAGTWVAIEDPTGSYTQ